MYGPRQFDDYADKTVKLIAFPLPPTRVGRLSYMPDSFASSVPDFRQQTEDFKVISVKMTAHGPALLSYTKLNFLIGFKNSLLVVHRATCCASVSLNIWSNNGAVDFANLTTLDRVNPIARSCHPGSHFVVPHAPFLTSLLQYAQAPSAPKDLFYTPDKVDEHIDDLFMEYLSPYGAEALFEHCDFLTNRGVDKFVANCAISSKVEPFRAIGLGQWGVPLLAKMRRNLLEESNDDGQTEVSVDAVQEGSRQQGENAFIR